MRPPPAAAQPPLSLFMLVRLDAQRCARERAPCGPSAAPQRPSSNMTKAPPCGGAFAVGVETRGVEPLT